MAAALQVAEGHWQKLTNSANKQHAVHESMYETTAAKTSTA
jgi:hypothetical protein